MAEGYTKLFSGIVMSTVWTYDSDTKVAWITLLAMADERGQVIGTIPGLAKMAGVSIEATRKAIAIFLAPDPDSGSKEFDGRRIEQIDRGWRLLMHAKYRALRSKEEKLEADRIRIATKRADEKSQVMSQVSQVSQVVAEVAHAEASAEAEEIPPLAGDPTAQEQAAAAPFAVPQAIASAVADARGVSLTQLALLALWKRVRDEETGTNSGPAGSGGFGIGPERIRDTYEQVIGEPEGPTVVEQSMRRFWRAVKSGEHPKAADCAQKPSLAWACWTKDFASDVMAARGAIPVIQKRDRAGPPGRDQPPPKAYATLNRRGP